jgi:hypothetical protein
VYSSHSLGLVQRARVQGIGSFLLGRSAVQISERQCLRSAC